MFDAIESMVYHRLEHLNLILFLSIDTEINFVQNESETNLNKTKWKLNIGDSIGAFVPYLSPIFDHFGE
jgi:hypothetical protein